MRLWSLDPGYLDARGLVALWREALLAQKVLRGETRGYRHHPQLRRFSAQPHPPSAIAAYLRGVLAEAARRGYRFDAGRICGTGACALLPVTAGQLSYELKHLRAKLAQRDPARLGAIAGAVAGCEATRTHPLFAVVAGPVEDWEIRP